MKLLTTLLLILTSTFLYNYKKDQINSQNNQIVEYKFDLIKNGTFKPNSLSHFSLDKIVGKYYVDNFYNYLKSGFVLKNEKPTNDFMLYTFNFKENGEVAFNDLTEFYDCGNGILKINYGNWKALGNETYELTFKGEYAQEYKFQTKSEYKLVKLKNGNLYMKLSKVLINNKTLFHE